MVYHSVSGCFKDKGISETKSQNHEILLSFRCEPLQDKCSPANKETWLKLYELVSVEVRQLRRGEIQALLERNLAYVEIAEKRARQVSEEAFLLQSSGCKEVLKAQAAVL